MLGPETHIATDPNYDPKTDGTDVAHPIVYDGRAYAGLSKREFFAAKALQGLLSIEEDNHLPMETHAEYAVEAADALIDALNKGGNS